MEIYIALLEEDARKAGKEPDIKAVGDRDDGMRAEYKQACRTCWTSETDCP